MILKYIDLKNFRLHKNTFIEFSKNINYIIGGNGQGKTSLLEAIYYLCTTRNINQSSDIEALSFSQEFFEINGTFEEFANNKVKIYFDKTNNKKNIFLDDKQIYKASEIIGRFPVVALLQSDHSITQGAPAERRRFIDSIIAQASATYLKLLLEYNKILRNRSALLSKLKEKKSIEMLNQLEVWTISLVKVGSEIIEHRINFIKDFKNYILLPYKNIMGGMEIPSIKYNPFDNANTENIDIIFKDKIQNLHNEEILRARNLVGPHKDDFEFFIDNIELKKYGSQGQHKTFQIALRFSEFFFLKDKLNLTPLFLMDDVFGELDIFRAKKISEYLRKIGQAFITLTDFSNSDLLIKSDRDLLVKVDKGNVAYA